MTRSARFGKLEPERERTRPESEPIPSLESRFGGEAAESTAGPEDEGLDDRTSLVRCAFCRKDSPAAAETCGSCGAAFSTPEQRAFNEALEKRRQLVRESRIQAEEKAAEARRVREERQREAQDRRHREEQDRLAEASTAHASFTSDPVGHVAREVGGAAGKSLARLFPNPGVRLAVVSGTLLLGAVVVYLSPLLRAFSCFGIVALIFLLASLNRIGDFLRRR